MSKPWKLVIVVLILALIWWARSAVVIVDEAEMAIVTRFGRPLTEVLEPGPHLKAPWPVDKVLRFDNRLMVFDHEPTEFLTQDKKNIVVDSYACWRIGDVKKFLATVRNRDGAEARLLDVITAVLGAAIGNYPITNFISTEAENVKLRTITREVLDEVTEVASRDYGLRVVDFHINSFNFPRQNRSAVIKRMQAERERIATRYRSEGEENAMKIEADTNKEVRGILAEANREAAVIRGEGEAEAIRIYGEVFGRNPDFYRFLRTLEAYDSFMDEKTTIFLRSDSALMRLIEEGVP